jgi:hypothetical protein
MRRLTIVFYDAGGGHRNAAEALKSALESQPRRWDVSVLNLQEVLDSIDVVRHLTGLRLQDAYNLVLRRGWTRLTPQLLVLLRGVLRLNHQRIVGLLENYWAQHPTDLVLSVVPHFNRALPQSMRKVLPGKAFVTLLTDFADYPPHFWIERESEYLICGTERAQQQALALGHPPHRIFPASGMVLKPKFYQQPAADKVNERKRLGLDPHLATGLVLFGGHGSGVMVEIARRLDADSNRGSANQVQLIMICGHNQKLLNRLKNLRLRTPIFVEGFTPNVAYYMSLADFFIGKPGPGSISEALQFHLPVIVERNSRTMPQERYNTEWVTEKQLGIVVTSFRQIATGVRELLAPATFERLRHNARAYSNRALFEVPQILDEVFEQRAAVSRAISSAVEQVDVLGEGAAWAGST